MEPCRDPVAFARGSAGDDAHDRVLLIVLRTPLDTTLLDAVGEWAATCPVVGLHVDLPVRLRLQAMAHGVTSVVPHAAEPSRVLRAAHAVTAGDAVLDAATLEVLTALLPQSDEGVEALTEDERRWLIWLAQGETVSQMSARTGWSDRHFRRRLRRLYLHLGVDNRDQAVALAGRLGLVAAGDTAGG